MTTVGIDTVDDIVLNEEKKIREAIDASIVVSCFTLHTARRAVGAASIVRTAAARVKRQMYRSSGVCR